jgi:hypothetical protein
MFTLPSPGEHEPAEIYARLVDKLPEFEPLKTWTPLVGFLFRDYPDVQQQRAIIGTCSMPQAQGRVRKLFEWLMEEKLGYFPIFLYTLDHDFWTAATPRQREILMYHEICHAGIALDAFGSPKHHRETGEPIWCIVGHDVEEFTAVVQRYGAYSDDLLAFKNALSMAETD